MRVARQVELHAGKEGILDCERSVKKDFAAARCRVPRRTLLK